MKNKGRKYEKIVILFIATSIIFTGAFFAAERDYEGNFSVKTWYHYYWNCGYDNVWAGMRNWDAAGYYGNATVRLDEKIGGSWYMTCQNNDLKLVVNETVSCTGQPLDEVAQYQTMGYYNTINGSSTTKDQVYTILS